jgi:uncharacterized membrane protein YkvA (DUF1232 family)
MSNEQHNWLGPYLGSNDVVHQVAQQMKLFYRLMRDPRVHWLTKMIPVAVGVYLVSPIDWLQNAVPVLGQLGDVALIALGFRLFLEFSPPEVVHEHLMRLLRTEQTGRSWNVVDDPTVPAPSAGSEPDVIDATYRIEK